MAIALQTSDYTGRKKDLSILQYPNVTVPDGVEVAPSFGSPSRFCAGVQKLIQRYTVLMLTNVNSQEYYPDFGADFLWPLQSGTDPTDSIVARQIFTLADYATVSVIKNYQIDNPDIPLDEQLDFTTLRSITLYGGYVSFDVKLTTFAGEVVDFLVPLPK
jgi:hypothetical protein